MKKIVSILIGIGVFIATPIPAFATTNNEVAQGVNQTLLVLIGLASLSAVFFLVRGGIQYMTSSGRPDDLDHAKITIRNALIGLVLVIGAGVVSSLLHTAFTTSPTGAGTDVFKLSPIQPASPQTGLTQVLIDAMTGFMQAIVQSATKPIIDGIISFLTATPSFMTNSVIFNFWLIMLGIVDSLFILVIALLGFHIMSASTFGFDELEFKHLLPRIGLAFLGANCSLFLISWVIGGCDLLVQAVLHATGGLDHAWILNAFDPKLFASGPDSVGSSMFITLIFMLLFIILAVLLLLMYISRLVVLAVGAVLAPFIFLLWLIPDFTDFATIAMKSYLIVIFTVFIHVVIIQLASSFLTLPGQSGTNVFISVLVGIATLFTLLKVPGTISQFAFYNSASGGMRKLGGQIVNVVSSAKTARVIESA